MSTRTVGGEPPLCREDPAHLTGRVFSVYRGPEVRAELQIEGDGRGGLHEPGDARRDPLQLLGPFQRVRTGRVSGESSFMFVGSKKGDLVFPGRIGRRRI